MFNVAVTVAVSVAPTVPTVTVKVAVVAPAGMVTLVGTGNAAVSDVSVTVVTPVGTATDRITEHVVVAPESTVSGLHWTEDSTGVAKIASVTTLLRNAFCAI